MVEYFIALVAGFVSFISPCVLPLVPAYIGYMGGRVTQTVSGQVQADGTLVANRAFSQRFSTFMHGLAFVGGFTLIFVALGVATAFVSTIGGTNVIEGIIGRVGGILIVFFGIHFSGLLGNVFMWLRQSGAVAEPTARFGAVTGVLLLMLAILVSGLVGYLDGIGFLVGDAYLAIANNLTFLPHGNLFVIHAFGSLLLMIPAYFIGRGLFNLYNRSANQSAEFVLGTGAIAGLIVGVGLLMLTTIGDAGLLGANVAHLAIFGLWGAAIGGIFLVQKDERSGFDIIVDNVAFSAVIAIIGAGMISWGITGTLEIWNTTAYPFWSGMVALVLMAVFLVSLVLRGAFIEPGPLWFDVMDRLQYMLNVDTRKQMGGGENKGLLSSGVMGVVFAAGWSPCIGPTLGVALTLAANNPSGADLAEAGGLMAAYSLGLGIPFLITALALDSAQGGLRRLTRHMNTIKVGSGALLVGQWSAGHGHGL